MYRLEFSECEQWWDIGQFILLIDALHTASLYCRQHHQDSIRILDPDGKEVSI